MCRDYVLTQLGVGGLSMHQYISILLVDCHHSLVWLLSSVEYNVCQSHCINWYSVHIVYVVIVLVFCYGLSSMDVIRTLVYVQNCVIWFLSSLPLPPSLLPSLSLSLLPLSLIQEHWGTDICSVSCIYMYSE